MRTSILCVLLIVFSVSGQSRLEIDKEIKNIKTGILTYSPTIDYYFSKEPRFLTGIAAYPSEKVILPGSSLPLETIKIVARYSDFSEKNITLKNWELVTGAGTLSDNTFFSSPKTSSSTLKFGYSENGVSASAPLSVEVKDVTLSKITILPDTQKLFTNSKFYLSDAKVYAWYSDNTSYGVSTVIWNVNEGGGRIESGVYYSPATSGIKTLICEYTEGINRKTASLNIETTTLLLDHWNKASDIILPVRGHSTVLYKNRIWIIGGEYYSPYPHLLPFIFYSSDGCNWKNYFYDQNIFAEPFSERKNHACAVFDNKIWLTGGEPEKTDIYSTDGFTWEKKVITAPYGIRFSHTLTEFNQKLWLIGGDSGNGLKNDVWCSSNGIDWNNLVKETPFSRRKEHVAFTFNNLLWVIGGKDENGTPLNDVWNTSDGIIWNKIPQQLEFTARYALSCLIYKNKIYLIAGNNGTDLNDIWYSDDGKNWFADTAAEFSPRHDHTSVVIQDRMFAIGGLSQNSGSAQTWMKIPSDTLLKPENIIADNVGQGTCHLFWPTVPGASSYKIYVNDIFYASVSDTTTNIGTFSDLYIKIQISAQNNLTESEKSEPLTVNFIPPTPFALELLEKSETSVTFGWKPQTGGLSFKVYVNNEMKISTSTSPVSVSGLTPETVYAFQVTSSTSYHQSPLSAPLNVTTENTAPLPPSILKTDYIWSTSAAVSWNQAEPGIQYKVYLDNIPVCVTSETMLFKSNLISEHQYKLEVSSIKNSKEGIKSHPIYFTTAPLTLPPPSEITTGALTSSSITIKWNSVPKATRYLIQMSSPVFKQIYSSSLSVTFSGLQPDTACIVNVASVCENCLYHFSEPITVYTAPVFGPPTDVTVFNITSNSLGARWTAKPGYTYRMYVNDNFTGTAINTRYASNLLPESIYKIQISSVLNGTESSKSSPVFACTAVAQSNIAQPENLSSQVLPDGTFGVSWINPLTTGIPFKVCIDGTLYSSTPCTGVIFSGVSEDHTYRVEVSSLVDGQESLPVSIDVLLTSKPRPPENIKVAFYTNQSIILTWDSENSGAEYRIYADNVPVCVTSDSPARMYNLNSGHLYSLQVSKIINNIEGPRSYPLLFQTLSNFILTQSISFVSDVSSGKFTIHYADTHYDSYQIYINNTPYGATNQLSFPITVSNGAKSCSVYLRALFKNEIGAPGSTTHVTTP